MPARTSLAPRRLPCRLPFFLRLPQHKIQRILLLILAADQKRTVTGTQIIQILMRQLPVIFKLPGPEIHRSILLVCKSLLDQRADHIKHPFNLLSRKRMGRGRLDIHSFHILLTFCNISCRNLIGRHALFICLLNNLIIHICKIGHVIYIVALVFKISAHRVKYDHRSCISNVDKIVNRRSADIHLNLSFLHRNKFFFSLRHRIIQLHLFSPSSSPLSVPKTLIYSLAD